MNNGDTNLLEETIECLNSVGKEEKDVYWVGTYHEWMSWENFKKIACDFNYDSGFGGTYVNEELLIIGMDWWLERFEYDGSEYWSYKRLERKPEKYNKSLSLRKEKK